MGVGDAMAVVWSRGAILLRLIGHRSRGIIGKRMPVGPVKPHPTVAVTVWGILPLFLYAPIAPPSQVGDQLFRYGRLAEFARDDLKWFLRGFVESSFKGCPLEEPDRRAFRCGASNALGRSRALPFREPGDWPKHRPTDHKVTILIAPVVLGHRDRDGDACCGIEPEPVVLDAGHTLTGTSGRLLVNSRAMEGLAAKQELGTWNLGASPVRALIRGPFPDVESLAEDFL